ncbi:hypothetical protein [Corynebacterium sp. A21]|uniref:hypothetical protein n=1 Tax=Corynebacterium sp. A21 TaxID=3457318 RepID=UPI003FD31853
MMRVFADENKLAEYMRDLPEDAAQWLIRASALVSKATRSALYDTDPAGMPTDPEVIEAMAVATCLQVAEWQGAGLNPVAGVAGQEQKVASSSLDGASVTLTQVSEGLVTVTLTELCDLSQTVLDDAGLSGWQPWAR